MTRRADARLAEERKVPEATTSCGSEGKRPEVQRTAEAAGSDRKSNESVGEEREPESHVQAKRVAPEVPLHHPPLKDRRPDDWLSDREKGGHDVPSVIQNAPAHGPNRRYLRMRGK